MFRNIISEYSFHLYRIIQAMWAFALIVFVIPLMIINTDPFSVYGIYIIAICFYMCASVGIFYNIYWAWTFSIIFLLIYWALIGWKSLIYFVYNFYLFFNGHELYQDSPATIFIVIIRACLGIFPAAFLLLLGIVSRARIVEILKNETERPAQ